MKHTLFGLMTLLAFVGVEFDAHGIGLADARRSTATRQPASYDNERELIEVAVQIQAIEERIVVLTKQQKRNSRKTQRSLKSSGGSANTSGELSRLRNARENLVRKRDHLMQSGSGGSSSYGGSSRSSQSNANACNPPCRSSEICKYGRCTNASCDEGLGLECDNGLHCDYGKCVECKKDEHCGSHEVCRDNTCVPRQPDGKCSDDKDCPCGQRCRVGLFGGSCVESTCNWLNPDCGSDCPSGKECLPPIVAGGNSCKCRDYECPEGKCCGWDGECSKDCECRWDMDCPDGQCIKGKCVTSECKSDYDCKGGLDCEHCDTGGLFFDRPGKCKKNTDFWGNEVQCPQSCTRSGAACTLGNGTTGCCKRKQRGPFLSGYFVCEADGDCQRCRSDQTRCPSGDGIRCCDTATETCERGQCVPIPPDPDCDDGRNFCDGKELCCPPDQACINGACVQGTPGSGQCTPGEVCCPTTNTCYPVGGDCPCPDGICFGCDLIE